MRLSFARNGAIHSALAAALLLSGCSYAQSSAIKQGIVPHAPQQGYGHYYGQPQYGQPVPKYASFDDRLRGRRTLPFQSKAVPPPGAFQQWIEYEPAYTLYPGDQLDIVVPSAPELSRTLTVGPDGRVAMPMVSPVMAAGRTFAQLQGEISAQLAKQLRDPSVAVSPRAYAPEQVFVGGEVGQPGTYTLPGPIGAIETVFMAGGVRPTARASEIAVLRRAPNGGMMMRVVDLRNGLDNIREYNDNIQLRRGDIIFVPRTTLAEVGVFVQNFRNALPVDFNLSYQFVSNGADGGTTFISN